MGIFVNSVVILLGMAIFGQTGATLTPNGSRSVLALMYGQSIVALFKHATVLS